jgi:oxygen-dependent protoporphyrinogen oxidase
MYLLVDALAEDVAARGGTVRTRTRVVRVTREPGGGYRLEPASGPTLLTRRLVVATPQAPELLADVAPALADVQLDHGALVTLVTLVLDEPALDGAPRGTGVLVAREARDVEAKALTHATAKWAWLAREAGPGRHVVRLSYGRADDAPAPDVRPGPASAAESEALVAQARREAAVLLGVPLGADRLVGSSVVRWSQALPRPSAAHRDAVATVRTAVATLPGVAVCGAWVAGNGLASVVPDARDAARALARREPF